MRVRNGETQHQRLQWVNHLSSLEERTGEREKGREGRGEEERGAEGKGGEGRGREGRGEIELRDKFISCEKLEIHT